MLLSHGIETLELKAGGGIHLENDEPCKVQRYKQSLSSDIGQFRRSWVNNLCVCSRELSSVGMDNA
jgi:hypothetical protein